MAKIDILLDLLLDFWGEIVLLLDSLPGKIFLLLDSLPGKIVLLLDFFYSSH